VSQTTFPSPCNDAQVATDSGWIKIQAALENAARCIPLCGLVHCPIFRVPEYSELSIVSALGAHELRSVELVGSEYSALPI
jgi:hypothetical protein